MPIPQFQESAGDESDVLPSGVHPCDDAEFKAIFVSRFPDSRTRRRIWRGFAKLRLRMNELEIHSIQWVDGSFVTSKLNPNDVDVVSFVDAAALNSLATQARRLLEKLQNSDWSKQEYQTHHFTVPVYDPGDQRHATFELARRYWRKWWGQTRSGNRKGFVMMKTGDPNRSPAIPD